MSNETKRDVFDETLSNLKKMDAQIEEEWGYSQLTMGVGKHGDVESTREIAIAEIRDRYDAALPDDLPVVPKAVGEYIKGCQTVGGVHNLIDAFAFTQGGIAEKWIYEHSDTFALAWLLGDWEVEDEPA